MITVDEVKNRIEEIKANFYDDAAQHSLEDSLHGDVLQGIAKGAPNAQELATEALKTWKIKFERWVQ